MSVQIVLDLITKADEAQTLKSVKQSIRELQSAALQYQETNVQAYTKIVAKAAELKDKLNDLTDTTKALAGNHVENLTKSFGTMATSAIGGFQIIQGAMAAFGTQSNATVQTLAQLQGLMSMTQGIKELANIGQAYKDFRSAIANAIGTLTLQTTATEAQTVATEGQTVATEGATIAQKGLNAAMLANPIAATIVAVIALAGAYAYFTNKTEEQRQKQLDADLALNQHLKTIEEYKRTIDNISLKNSQLINNIDEETAALQNNEKARLDNIDKLKRDTDEKIINARKNKELIDALKEEAGLKKAVSSSFIDPASKALFQYQLNKLNEAGSVLSQYKKIRENAANELKQINDLAAITAQNISISNFKKDENLRLDLNQLSRLASTISIRNEFEKQKKIIEISRETELAKNKLEGDNINKRNLINQKYDNLKLENEQKRDDKINALSLAGKQTELDRIKLTNTSVIESINNTYQKEKQLLQDKLNEDIRLNEGNDNTIENLKKEHNNNLIKLEQDKNQKLADLRLQEQNLRLSSLQFQINQSIRAGVNPTGLGASYLASVGKQAGAAFDASEQGKQLQLLNDKRKNGLQLLLSELDLETRLKDKRKESVDEAIENAKNLVNNLVNEPSQRSITRSNAALLAIDSNRLQSGNYARRPGLKAQDISTGYDARLNKIEEQYQIDLKLAKDNADKKKEIEAKHKNDLLQLNEWYRAKLKEQNQITIEDDIRSAIVKTDILKENEKQYFESAINLRDLFYTLQDNAGTVSAEKEEQRAKERFNIEKALMLSLAIPQAATNILGAWEGIGKAGGNPVKSAIAIANLVATTTASILNVTKIATSQFQKSQSTGSISSGNNAPAINLYGTGSNINNLGVVNENKREQIRTYVLYDDIALAETNLSRYKTSVTLG